MKADEPVKDENLSPEPPEPAAQAQMPMKIVWDDSNMATTYANVVNVLHTPEEIAILFGMNLTWNASSTKEITVNLSNRMVLNPRAAKRLNELLTNRLRDYESRFGTLKL